MASVRKENDRGREGWRLQFVDAGKRRRSLWLGDVPKRAAETIARHVSELVRAYGAGVAPEVESARWANELTGRLRQRLAILGLVGAERKSQTVDAVRLCKPYFENYIASRGVKPWPKTFVNLRASCRTDLQEKFPDHVINTWLGHSSRVAERHYLQTTDAHWERAGLVTAVFGGVAGGALSVDLEESGAPLNAKIPGNMALDSARFPGIPLIMPPQGLG